MVASRRDEEKPVIFKNEMERETVMEWAPEWFDALRSGDDQAIQEGRLLWQLLGKWVPGHIMAAVFSAMRDEALRNLSKPKD